MATPTYKTIRIKGGARVALKNTSGRDDKEVVKMVRFGLEGMDIGNCAVHFKGWHRTSGANYGRAYYHIPSVNGSGDKIPLWCNYLIVVRNHPGGDAWIVDTIAHEGRHIEDYRSGRNRRGNPDKRGSEARARAWAAKRARDWEAA